MCDQASLLCNKRKKFILQKGTDKIEKELKITEYIKLQKYVRAMLEVIPNKLQKAQIKMSERFLTAPKEPSSSSSNDDGSSGNFSSLRLNAHRSEPD